MICPNCKNATRVSHPQPNWRRRHITKRRHECQSCGTRFNSFQLYAEKYLALYAELEGLRAFKRQTEENSVTGDVPNGLSLTAPMGELPNGASK
jgi:transcriptional regulator NrdR family protein